MSSNSPKPACQNKTGEKFPAGLLGLTRFDSMHCMGTIPSYKASGAAKFKKLLKQLASKATLFKCTVSDTVMKK